MSVAPVGFDTDRPDPRRLPVREAVVVFLAFALAYFLSGLLRGVTATLAPVFSAELGLGASQLGLLAGAYFLGFALMQLPLGSALDRFGPRRVLLWFLGAAVVGCAAFAAADRFTTLVLARGLIGVGVSACLMAPMTAFRRAFGPAAQLRANSWMLMVGSLGLVASTVPVQWLQPWLGWRGLFWVVAGAIVLAMLTIRVHVPADPVRQGPLDAHPPAAGEGLATVWRNPTFLRFAPLGFFYYGGMIAVQTLWAGPWLVQVCGWSPGQAAQGLLVINLSMLLAFFSWGVAVPRLHRRGFTALALVKAGAPLGCLALLVCVALGARATAAFWALFCVACTSVSLAQPAVGQAFPVALAGRALTAYNLVIFAGIFTMQSGIGLAIDLFLRLDWPLPSAYRGAMALLLVCAGLSYLWFLWHGRGADRGRPAGST